MNSPRWRLWWVRGMLLTYHYRHKCSGSTFRVAGAAASVADFTLVADDLGALALAGWKLFLAASLRTLELAGVRVCHPCGPVRYSLEPFLGYLHLDWVWVCRYLKHLPPLTC